MGVAEGLDRQLAAQRLGDDAVVGRQRREHPRVVRGVDHHRDAAEVLGRRPHHRRAADVDLLDHLVKRGLGVGGGLAERVEIDDHQVDAVDLVRGELLGMRRVRAAGQDAGVDARMQRLDAAVEDLGETGHVGDGHRRDAELAQVGEGAAGRDDLDAEAAKPLGQLGQAALIGNGNQCAMRRQHDGVLLGSGRR